MQCSCGTDSDRSAGGRQGTRVHVNIIISFSCFDASELIFFSRFFFLLFLFFFFLLPVHKETTNCRIKEIKEKRADKMKKQKNECH